MRLRALFVASLLVSCNTDKPGGDVDTDGPGCAYQGPDISTPGALQVGFARRRVPAPVGVGTVGYGPSVGISSPSPFSDIYPGTKNIHGHPEIKVMTLSRGPGHEAIFVRLDSVGVFSQLRTDIVEKASELVGRDLDHAILLGATHTHSGPGGVLNSGADGTSLFDIIADKFHPEFYSRFVDDVAGAIADSVTDMGPGRVGFVTTDCPDGHNDRRCEDGDHQNGTTPMIAIEKDGEIKSVLLAYAVHGTVFDRDTLYLSQDVSGAIEEAIEDRFDHPVDAIMFNAWGADMSPADPVAAPLDAEAAESPNGFLQQRRAGWAVANAVQAKLADIQWETEPEIDLQVHRVGINRQLIGYADNEFPFEYGGVYCGNGSGTCDPATTYDWSLADSCIPFNEQFPAPTQTDITVGKIGPFAVMTWPGESGTLLAEKLMADIQADNPDITDFLYLGYTQDYLGYAILEEDWFLGGYEASGALWGPKQGVYLSDQIRRLYAQYRAGTCPTDEPARLEPFPYAVSEPYQVESSINGNTVVTDVSEFVPHNGVIEFTIDGQDPWLGAPTARLVHEDGTPVLRPNGTPVDSDDYNFDVNMAESPTYADNDEDGKIDHEDRTFTWRFRMPAHQPVVGGVALEDGVYRVVVSVPQADGSSVDVQSALFNVVTSVCANGARCLQ